MRIIGLHDAETNTPVWINYKQIVEFHTVEEKTTVVLVGPAYVIVKESANEILNKIGYEEEK